MRRGHRANAVVSRVLGYGAEIPTGSVGTTFSEVLTDWFKTFVGLEGLAESQFICVLPTRTYAHAGNVSEFTLLHFDQAQTVGHIEYPTGALYLQEYAWQCTRCW